MGIPLLDILFLFTGPLICLLGTADVLGPEYLKSLFGTKGFFGRSRSQLPLRLLCVGYGYEHELYIDGW